jgi:hypothetical protein
VISNWTIATRDTRENGETVGLFGMARRAEIKNLGVIDGTVTGYAGVGAICGVLDQSSRLVACYNKGVTVESLDRSAGGICGFAIRDSEIIACYNTADVYSFYQAGGIVGNSWGSITACYNTGRVYSDNTPDASLFRLAGGILGWRSSTDYPHSITACYWFDHNDDHAVYGNRNVLDDVEAEKFDATHWPSSIMAGWGDNYWSSLGDWGSSIFPKLHFEQ